ncbi:unnamed protein product, partial [Porites lobata]
VLLASPEIPPATKKIRVKAMGPEVRRATKRVRTMTLPGADDDDEFAQGPMETFLKTLVKSSTPQPRATPKGKPKLPTKPKIPPKTPISLRLPDDDWEEELAAPIPSTSKSKGSATLNKGKSPLSVSRPPLTVKKPSRFGQAAKEGKKLAKETGIEFHWPGYQYMGPGTHLEKRLKRGDPGINRLDRIAKQHDIDYSRARNLQDKWKTDDKMIRAIQTLPGKKTWTEAIVKKIMQAKRKLKL